VPKRRLRHVLKDCRRTLHESRRFAADAVKWSLPGSHPHISRKRCDWITEQAFLRAFLALEAFLEESFVLYSLGDTAPKGSPPHRFTFPPTRKHADEWVVPEGRRYAGWEAERVIDRAQRFFRAGAPFANALRGNQAALGEARTIRNAIAHNSTAAQAKFESLVRTKLGTLPPSLRVGSFLGTLIPSSTPPQSFLELYLDKIEFVITQIVRVS
jgi:hypothetical protein